MKLIFAVLLVAFLSIVPQAQATTIGPGPAPDGTAIAEYDYNTGEIIVSVANVINWYINSASASLSGPDDAVPPLPQGGGSPGDNDLNIGETNFSQFSYTDLYLGQVALPNLPLGDLNIYWASEFGVDPISQPVVYVGLPVPEPASLGLALLGLFGIGCLRRHRI